MFFVQALCSFFQESKNPVSENLLAVFYALASAIGAATFSLIVRRAQNHGSAFTGVVIGLIVNIPWLCLATFLLWQDSWWNTKAFLLFALSGLSGPSLGRLFMFRAIHQLGVSRASPMLSMNPLFSAFFAFMFLGERPGHYIWLGTLLVVIGGASLSLRTKKDIEWKRISLLLPIISVLGFSVSNIFRKLGVDIVPSPILGITITSISGLFSLYFFSLFSSKENKPDLSWGKSWWLYGISGFINTLAFLSHYAALVYGDLTIVSPLTATAPFFALFMSWLLLRDVERVTLPILIGTILIVSGGLLIVMKLI